MRSFRRIGRRLGTRPATPPESKELIVYRELARYGQLGNQLWQIAGTLGIAAARGAEARFPPWKYRRRFSVPRELFCVDLPQQGIDAWSIPVHIPESHRYFLQDAGLFAAIEDVVREYFQPSPVVRAQLESKFAEFLRLPAKTALHVRRGDYFDHPDSLVVASLDYYHAAVAMLGETNLIVFSDDIDWCRRHLDWANPRLFMEGSSAYDDLFLMTQCDRHIIANSSFSWWGAYLANDRQAIFPRRWFGPALAHVDERLMFLDGWVGIDA